jgi:CPA2 family monovalent cation:H+ antiporter-2
MDQAFEGVVRDGVIETDVPLTLEDGTRVLISTIAGSNGGGLSGHVIVVGFGLAGRCVADLLSQAGLSFTIIEKNPVTVETQRALGREIVEGNAAEAETLVRAGLNQASILALTIPDEQAVIEATAIARRLNPDIYIMARTNYSSQGMKCRQMGADEVIKAEQAVALQFYDRLGRRLRNTSRESTEQRA